MIQFVVLGASMPKLLEVKHNLIWSQQHAFWRLDMRKEIRGRAYLVKLLGFTGKIRQVLSFSFPPLPSSFFLHPSSFILLPSSFFLLPSSFFFLALLPSSFFLLLSCASSFFLLPSSFFLLPSSLSFFKETNDFTDIIEDLTIGGKLRDRVYGVSG